MRAWIVFFLTLFLFSWGPGAASGLVASRPWCKLSCDSWHPLVLVESSSMNPSTGTYEVPWNLLFADSLHPESPRLWNEGGVVRELRRHLRAPTRCGASCTPYTVFHVTSGSSVEMTIAIIIDHRRGCRPRPRRRSRLPCIPSPCFCPRFGTRACARPSRPRPCPHVPAVVVFFAAYGQRTLLDTGSICDVRFVRSCLICFLGIVYGKHRISELLRRLLNFLDHFEWACVPKIWLKSSRFASYCQQSVILPAVCLNGAKDRSCKRTCSMRLKLYGSHVVTSS